MKQMFFPNDEARVFLEICRKIFDEVSLTYGTPESSPVIETGDDFIRVTRACTVFYDGVIYKGILHLEERYSFRIGNFSSKLALVLDACDPSVVFDLSKPMFSFEIHRNQNDGLGINRKVAKLRHKICLMTDNMHTLERWWPLVQEMKDRFGELPQDLPKEINVIERAA